MGTEDLLASLEQQLDAEVALYVENLWEEVEPEAGHRLRAADAQVGVCGGRLESEVVMVGSDGSLVPWVWQVRQREEMLRQVKSEVVEERNGQEALLRQMKAAGGARVALLRGGIDGLSSN